MSMKDTIQDALDDISSPTSSSNRRFRALAVLEQQLALACAPDVQDDTMRNFLELQDTFECNVPSRVFSWIQTAATQVESLAGKSSCEKDRETELNAICSQLYQLLSIIQGIVLHHVASKTYLGRRLSLEILVALLTASRHTSMITPVSMGSSTSSQVSYKTSSVAHLSSAVLDAFLCILVDSSPALRTFEEVNGVQAVVKILKRAGTLREVRMKCLEFLYFYLMDETAQDVNGGLMSLVAQSTPSTPVATEAGTPMRTPGRKIFPRSMMSASSSSFISSSSSSSSSSSPNKSTSSVASDASRTRTPSPVKKSYSSPAIELDAPAREKKTPRTLSTRPTMTLQNVDYEPQSPTKGHMPRLYVGESGDRVRTTEEKKEHLGTMLGNVDALVDGVRKAGVWGLV